MRFYLPRLRPITFGPLHVLLPMVALLVALFGYAALQTAAQNYHLAENAAPSGPRSTPCARARPNSKACASTCSPTSTSRLSLAAASALAYPGETVVLVDAPPSEEPGREPAERWWEVLFDR